MSVVGFIGLGTMGRPMARNLLKAGHQVVAYARRPDALSDVVAASASLVSSPAALAQAAEFVVTIVSADDDVREVTLGAGGIAEAATPDKMHIQMSTISPETTREIGVRLAERGMRMIDAPVSGGPTGAEAATLAIMVGGDAADVDRARPILGCMGDKVFHVGPLGAGSTVKLVNQMMAGGIMALVAEGLVLAKAAGVDLQRLADVVAVSSGNSTMFEARARKFILTDQYMPGFMTELMRKDVGLALELGRMLRVPLPLAAAAFQQYTAAINEGHGKDDFASIARLYQRAAGVTLVEPPR